MGCVVCCFGILFCILGYPWVGVPVIVIGIFIPSEAK